MKIYTIHHKGLVFFEDITQADKWVDYPYSDIIIYEGYLKDISRKVAESVAEIHPNFSKYFDLAMATLWKTYNFKGGTESPIKAIESRMSKKEKSAYGDNPYIVIWQALEISK